MNAKQGIIVLIILVLIVGSVLGVASMVVVKEGKQAVVTQFGKPVRFITDAGLYFRVPFFQEVHTLDKRLLPWDGAAESMQTRDKKRIFIDVWARWRITDLENFFVKVLTEQQGQKFLDDLVDSAVRNEVARNDLIEVVRSSNIELKYESEQMTELAQSSQATHDEVSTGRREQIETNILKAVTADLKASKYGMELQVVRIKRVNYVESVKDTVYQRMRSERLRIASLFESEAEEEKNRILGLTRKELDTIEGEMEQKSAEIRGEADAEVIRLTAEAYGKANEFYTFLRRLEVFKKTMGRDTRIVLTTDSDLFRMLKQTTPPTSPKPASPNVQATDFGEPIDAQP